MIERLLSFVGSQLANPWVLFGFLAQVIFFARFVIQWIASEREKKVVIPLLFWHLSILGALMILIYAIYRQDIVFIAGQLLALVIYIRNIFIRTNEQSYLPKKIS